MLSVTAAAAQLGLSPSHLRALCAAGSVAGADKIGGVWLLPDPPGPTRSGLSVAQAAPIVGMTISALYDAIRAGRVPGARKIGGCLRLPDPPVVERHRPRGRPRKERK